MALYTFKRGPYYYVDGINAAGFKIDRKSTKCTNREAAETFKRSLDLITTWPPPSVLPAAGKGIPFTEALEKYLKLIKPKTAESTRHQYDYVLTKYMFGFLKEKFNVTEVGQLTQDHLLDMQDGWIETLKTASVAAYRQNSETFVKFCVAQKWLTTNLWAGIPKADPDDDDTATLPLDDDHTDTNWQRLRASIIPYLQGTLPERKGAPHFGRMENPLQRNPEAMLALLEVMYHTGLRRSDAILFDPRQLQWQPGIGYWIYTIKQYKTNIEVTCFLEPWLAEKLRALPVLARTGLPFYDESRPHKLYLDIYVNTPLRNLGSLIGIPGLRPHRLRDSFAVNHLIDGGSLEDLKNLLGHASLSTTERYYAPWSKGRMIALGSRLAKRRETKREASAPPAAAAPPETEQGRKQPATGPVPSAPSPLETARPASELTQ